MMHDISGGFNSQTWRVLTHARPKCPQPEHLNNTSDYGPDIPFPECEIDEFDCLNLNVSTPREISGSFPVLFWIHGCAAWLKSTRRPLMTVAEGRS